MTSKLIVNELAADTGISTITVGDNMSGVTFKTGTSNLHNVGIEIAGINVLGADTPIGAGATIYNSGDVIVGGAVTATKFYGDGSALSGIIDQTVTINNQADNRVITGTGATNTLNGEANLTFDGNNLGINQASPNARIEITDTGTAQIRTGYNATKYARIGRSSSGHYEFFSQENGSPLVFGTAESSDGGGAEKMRIDRYGNTNIGAAAVNTAIHASGLFNAATPKFEVKLGAAANSYTRLINITNPGGQTGSESLGRVGIKLSLGSEASSGESNKSGIIYAESTSGYNNAVSLCFATNGGEKLRIDTSGRLLLGTQRTYSSQSWYDDITINNSNGSGQTGGTGISLISSSNSWNSIYFGDGDNESIGGIKYDHNTNSMRFVVNTIDPAVLIDNDGDVIIGTTSWSYPKPLNVQGSSGAILALSNYDTTSYAADTNTSIEFRIKTGNTGNQNGACEIRAFKENGTNGNNARGLNFWTAGNGGQPAERLRINSNGYVTKPNHPSFLARRSTAGDGRAAASPITEWSTNTSTPLHNIGSHFNASTGKFTAPVAGIYHFSACPGYKQTGNNYNVKFRLDNTDIFEPVRFIDGGDDLTSHSTGTGSITIYMNANQTMSVCVAYTHHVNATYNYFSGHLVG